MLLGQRGNPDFARMLQEWLMVIWVTKHSDSKHIVRRVPKRPYIRSYFTQMATPLNIQGCEQGQICELIVRLRELRQDMLRLEARLVDRERKFPVAQRNSARNFLHYLAMRGHDLRDLQEKLSAIGISSLSWSESDAMSSVERALEILGHLERSSRPFDPVSSTAPFNNGESILEERSAELFGPRSSARNARIMVTAPTEAAYDYGLVKDLIMRGMDCLRLNCAHDNTGIWIQIIENLKRARTETGKSCSLEMDIPGPKLRTGAIEAGPQVLKIRLQKDSFGRVAAPARIWFTTQENPTPAPPAADACLSVRAEWLKFTAPGDRVKFKDARGASRWITIAQTEGQNRWGQLYKSAYITPYTKLRLHSRNPISRRRSTYPLNIPPVEQFLLLKTGDTLNLTKSSAPGRPASYDNAGHLVSPATVGITPPEIFNDVRPGESIWFDDGRIGGVIGSVTHQQITVKITYARQGGEKLRADRGINLPDSELQLPPLTEKDNEILEFIVKHADLIGYSFVRDATGLRQLQQRIAALGRESIGIVLKIETRRGFDNLPELLLASMETGRVGVMIARGDLAVECGFERLAEIQEEILWLAEAAHIPVIWATQVLESMAKTGMPSRAEITDAAMAGRAECVMLNKGPHIVQAVSVLDDILRRMEAQHVKRRFILRPLSLAQAYTGRGELLAMPLPEVTAPEDKISVVAGNDFERSPEAQSL